LGSLPSNGKSQIKAMWVLALASSASLTWLTQRIDQIRRQFSEVRALGPDDQRVVTTAFKSAFRSVYTFNGALALLCLLCALCVSENDLPSTQATQPSPKNVEDAIDLEAEAR
jgi:hypothetical protein